MDFIIRCGFIILIYHGMSLSYAENTQLSLQNIESSAYAGYEDFINTNLPIFIASTDSLSEENYTQVSAKVSLILRQTKQLSATKNIARWLVSTSAKTMKPEVRYRWMMILSYDLMYFTEFIATKEMLEQELDSIKAWMPVTNGSKETQANLYHIYGQLLVRQQHVAKALPYFYQAEKWFRSVDDNHPSIFVINIILGEAFLHARNYEKAEQYAYKALNTIPEGRVDAISYLNAILASSLERQQRPKEAMVVISNYLANPIDPRKDYFLYFSLVHIDVLRDLGAFYEAYILAQDTYKLAQEIGNIDYLKDATRHLGFLQAHFGNMVDAEALLKEAIDSPSGIRHGNSVDAYLDYVEVLEKLGKYQAAFDYHRLYHDAYVEEHERINQITIARLELHQENQQLQQQQILSKVQLALAKANEKRTQLKNDVLIWAALILFFIMVLILIMFLQLRRKSHQLHDMAVSDQLTGLGNRHALLQALNNPAYTLLIIADIDSLKHYNDHYGHQKGDELIKNYATKMQHIFAPQQAQLFRIGGDEFAILIEPLIQLDTIQEWMDRAVQQIKSEGFSEVGVSYGIATRSEAETDYDWISLADRRMYEMKSFNKTRMV
jgi:diguanylate cyclase (GGDEF)-like protein